MTQVQLVKLVFFQSSHQALKTRVIDYSRGRIPLHSLHQTNKFQSQLTVPTSPDTIPICIVLFVDFFQLPNSLDGLANPMDNAIIVN